MPSLHWDLDDDVRVVDARDKRFVLVNRRTGTWRVTNRAGVVTYSRARTRDDLPIALQPIKDSRQSSASCETARSFDDNDELLIIYKLTDACNYRCTYCYDRKAARPKSAERRNVAIREALDFTLGVQQKRVCVLFHGGEPLLECDEIRDVVQAYERYWPDRLRFSIQTNLSLISEPVVEFVKRYRFDVSVSVDGTAPGANRLRVVGGRNDPYAVVLGATDTPAGLSRPDVNLLLTVGAHNVHSLPESLVRMQADGFRSAALSFVQEVNKSARHAEAESLCAVLKDVVGLIAGGTLSALAVWTIVQWVQQVAFARSESMCLASPCGAGRSLLTVFPSGEIGPCDSIFDPSYYSPSLPEYLASLADDGTLSHLLRRNVRSIEPCNDCDVRPYCNATCAGNVILEHGELSGVAAHECAFHYAWIKTLMWLLSDPAVGEPLMRYCAHHIECRRTARVAAFGR
jgi:uncharacterized protein